MKSTTRDYVVVIKVKSRTGARPIVRTLGGNTVFCALTEGMTASWTLKRKPKASKP